jgi:hypothetical protein
VGRVSLTGVLLAVALSAPPAGVAIWSIGSTVSQMMPDPCAHWDGSESHALSASLRPGDPCRSITGHGESRLRAATVCALGPGGVLVGAMLGIIGVAVSRRPLIFAGAFLMLAETLVVGTIAPLTLIAGLGSLVLARRAPRAEQVQL